VFICIGERMVNAAMITDVAWEKRRMGDRVLRVYLAAPDPASVGASDWSSEARSLTFDGEDAGALWNCLLGNYCKPPMSVTG
jgi:hypothetical protein